MTKLLAMIVLALTLSAGAVAASSQPPVGFCGPWFCCTIEGCDL